MQASASAPVEPEACACSDLLDTVVPLKQACGAIPKPDGAIASAPSQEDRDHPVICSWGSNLTNGSHLPTSYQSIISRLHCTATRIISCRKFAELALASTASLWLQNLFSFALFQLI